MNNSPSKINTFGNFENLSFHEESEPVELKPTAKSVSENIKRSLVVTPNTFSPSRDEAPRSQLIDKK